MNNTGYKIDLELTKGFPFYKEFSAYVSGVMFPLSGVSGFASMKFRFDDSSGTNFEWGVKSINEGTFFLKLTTGQTQNLNPGQYYYDSEITGSNFISARQGFGLVNVSPSIF